MSRTSRTTALIMINEINNKNSIRTKKHSKYAVLHKIYSLTLYAYIKLILLYFYHIIFKYLQSYILVLNLELFNHK